MSSIAFGPDNRLYFGVNGFDRIRRLESTLLWLEQDEALLIASEDGSEIYVFDGAGRHMRTLHALTGRHSTRSATTVTGDW